MGGEVKKCVTLSSKHQVTLPVDMLRKHGLRPGDKLDVSEDESGRLVLSRHKSRLDGVIGTVPGLENHLDLEALRNEWDD